MDRKYAKIGKEIGFSYLITVLQILFAPIIVALLTRTLGPGRYGVYVLLFALISFGSLVFQLGIPQYLIAKIYGYKKQEWPQVFFTMLGFEALVLSAFILLFYFSSASAYFLKYTKIAGYSKILALALITMLFTAVGRIYDYYYRAKQKLNIANFMEFLRSQGWALVLLLWFVCFSGFNLMIVFAMWLSFTLLSLLIYGWLDRAEIFSFLKRGADFSVMPPALKFGMPVIGAALASWILTYSDRYILSFYTSPETVGIYSVAVSILGVLLTFSVTVSNVILPYFAEAWWIDKKKFSTFLNANLKYGLAILIPGIVGAIILRRELITLLAGPKYIAAAPVVVILSLFPAFAFLTGVFGNCIFMENKPKLVMNVTALSAVVGIGLSFLLTPVYGMIGAATAIILSNFTNFSLFFYLSTNRQLIDLKFIKLGRIILSAIAMGAVLYFLHPQTILPKLLTIAFGGGIYLVLIFVTKVLNKNELAIIKSFLNK